MSEIHVGGEFSPTMRSLLKVAIEEPKRTSVGWHIVVCVLVVLMVFAFAFIPNYLPEFANALIGEQSNSSKILIGSLAVSIKTPFSIGHLLGLVMGIGGLIASDFLIFRVLNRNLVQAWEVDALKIISRFVTVGLSLLWTTGIGFLLYYSFFSQETLANPKIWAKITIVLVLTLNGGFIHRVVMPILAENIGNCIFSDHKNLANVLVIPGAVSLVSWAMAFFLGAMPALSFSIIGLDFIFVYVMALSVSIIIMHIFIEKLKEMPRDQTNY